MAERCINLRDWESRHLLEHGTLTLVRPVRLPRGVVYVPIYWDRNKEADGAQKMPCPLGEPGDTLIGRETWAAVWPGESEVPIRECRIEYRSNLPVSCLDGPGEWPPDCKSDPDAPKWMSPVVMPAWAARHRLTVESVEVTKCVPPWSDEPKPYPFQEVRFRVKTGWNEKRFPWATSYAWVVLVRRQA